MLHVLGSAAVSGTAQARIVAALARSLDPSRYPVQAWFVDEPGPLTDVLSGAGVPARTVLFRSRRDPAGVVRVAQALRRDRPEIVHLHVGGRSRVWLLQALSPAKRIAHLHGTSRDDGTALALEQFVRSSDTAIATSKAVAETAGPATVIYPGVDVPQSQASLREQPPTIGALGRLEPTKSLDVLVEAAAILSRRRPEVRVEIAGSGSCEPRLRSLAARLGVTDVVAFLGWREDVGSLHHRWQVLVQPSAHEGFGIAALEAMAAGLPVVASATGGLPELVEDERTGFLVPVGDVEALAGRLDRLLGDDVLRVRMGDAARQRAVRSFSVDEMAARTATVYDRLLGE